MKNLILFLLFLNSMTLYAQPKPPASKTVDSTDTYFGVTYKDPYRWLENIKSPEVEGWFKQQANYSNSILNKISGRDELIAELKMLDKLQPPRISDVDYENGRVFYRKTMPGEAVGKLYFREGTNGKEQLLFDPLVYIKGKTLSIQSFKPSYDGKKVLIAYATQGAEVATLKVLDVDTKQFLKDSIYPVYAALSWTFDNKSFFYGWLKTDDNKDPKARLNTKTKLHVLGEDNTADQDFFSNESYPDLKIDSRVYPFAVLNKDYKNYIIAGESSVQPEFEYYYAPIEQLKSGKINWQILCTPADKLVRGLETIDDQTYAITYNQAKNYKLVAIKREHPDWANAITIAAEKPDQTLESITRSKDFLFLTYSDGINNHLSKYDPHTKKITSVKLPYSGIINIYCPDHQSNNCIVHITSWNKPITEFNYNAAADTFAPGIFNKPPNYPDVYKNLLVKEVQVKGHDGTMVPLTIIYKKGIKLDGSNVCLMDSYGAYGVSGTPHFSTRENALAVKGVVVAIPHVRGGSEKGEAWYRAGYKTTKPNTWKDFISCAEYLIANGYTSANKLGGTGTSAGGILISRAITERPDLFAAAICNVGWANAMRIEFSASGPANIPEFGTVKDSTECKALYAMDGVQHVVTGTKYPAVICVGGWNDPRVVAWEPGKFAAALQNASSSGKPVLMKVNYDNGHFTEDKSVTYANFADQYAFVLWQCGHPDFKLKQ